MTIGSKATQESLHDLQNNGMKTFYSSLSTIWEERTYNRLVNLLLPATEEFVMALRTPELFLNYSKKSFFDKIAFITSPTSITRNPISENYFSQLIT